MATPTQYAANRFAQRSEHAADYKQNDNHQNRTHLSVDDLEQALSSDSTSQTNDHSNPHTNNAHEPLRVHVERVVRQYFALLGDEMPTDLYELILKEMERPLLSVVLEQTRGNQTKCAQILGLNRGTLRKKLKTYDLM